VARLTRARIWQTPFDPTTKFPPLANQTSTECAQVRSLNLGLAVAFAFDSPKSIPTVIDADHAVQS
jgi:hypothetical protein